jgi:hypothetical protein
VVKTPIEAPGGIAAAVNEQKLSLSEVKAAMDVDTARVLDSLIDKYLIDTEAQKRGIVVARNEIDDAVEFLRRANATEPWRSN